VLDEEDGTSLATEERFIVNSTFRQKLFRSRPFLAGTCNFDSLIQLLLSRCRMLMDKVRPDVVLDIEEYDAAVHAELPLGPRELLRQYIREGRLGRNTGL
jgi:hypothetical protein